MTSKYELTTETKSFFGTTLRRVKALRDIPRHGVKAGDLGGWIEKAENLSRVGECWVGGNAHVWGNASVGDPQHCITVGPVGSESITVTIYRTSDGHQVLAGCWGPGTLDELRAEVKRRERDEWAHRDPADVGRWTAQYKHIGLLGEALVASWDVERADEETVK